MGINLVDSFKECDGQNPLLTKSSRVGQLEFISIRCSYCILLEVMKRILLDLEKKCEE